MEEFVVDVNIIRHYEKTGPVTQLVCALRPSKFKPALDVARSVTLECSAESGLRKVGDDVWRHVTYLLARDKPMSLVDFMARATFRIVNARTNRTICWHL